MRRAKRRAVTVLFLHSLHALVIVRSTWISVEARSMLSSPAFIGQTCAQLPSAAVSSLVRMHNWNEGSQNGCKSP